MALNNVLIYMQIKEFNPAAITNAYEVFHLCTSKPLNFGVTKIYAACDMSTDGGGWMVIMQRSTGGVDFNCSMEEYEFGFGDLGGEFWYGLKNIHCLSEREPLELRIEIGNGTMPSIVWVYQTFLVDSAPSYTLHIGDGVGTGDTNDAMLLHNEKDFYTYNRDQGTCARNHGAGWWYYLTDNKNCHTANLNGPYQLKTNNIGDLLSWNSTAGYVHYTHVSMKVRPKICTPCKVDF